MGHDADTTDLRTAIDRGDVDDVRSLLAARPGLATAEIVWADGRCTSSSTPLAYACMARFHGLAGHERMAEVARALLDAGAPVDGPPGAKETPLVTAVSYGETGVVQVLIDDGADLEARGFAAPGGTALAHAAYFGFPEAARLLVDAGALVGSLAEAAAIGDLGDRLRASSPDERAWALRAAAVCERIAVIDTLLAAGTDIASVTDEGGTALHWAAWHGKVTSVLHLIERGADPLHVDAVHQSTPLGWCSHRHAELFAPSPGHDDVEHYLKQCSAPGQAR